MNLSRLHKYFHALLAYYLFYIVFHTPRESLNATIPLYFLTVLSLAILLPSSIAEAVIVFG